MAWCPPWGKSSSSSSPSPVINQWSILYSPGMPAAPEVVGDGFRLTFPTEGSLHYVVRGNAGQIGGAFNFTYRIDVADGVAFNPVDPKEGPPCKFSLYFQRRGDDLTAAMPHHRWFSRITFPLVATPAIQVSVPFEPSGWGSVFGNGGDQVPTEFAAAMADCQAVGVTFGGQYFAGHGVRASGQASITVSPFGVG